MNGERVEQRSFASLEAVLVEIQNQNCDGEIWKWESYRRAR